MHTKKLFAYSHKKGTAIGRIHHCNPFMGEMYYLRFLLTFVRSPQSFEHLCIVHVQHFNQHAGLWDFWKMIMNGCSALQKQLFLVVVLLYGLYLQQHFYMVALQTHYHYRILLQTISVMTSCNTSKHTWESSLHRIYLISILITDYT